MRDDEIRRIISEANPWWDAVVTGKDPLAWRSSHRLLKDRREYDLGYRAPILDDLVTQPIDGSLVILTGPRRIGKSVALLDTISALCSKRGTDPRQVIHVPCDGMRDRDLRRVITLGRALTRSVDQDQPKPRIWFFDEISGVSGWTSAIKAARDTSDFGDDTVVATGSRWIGNEDVQGNLLAGRAGKSNRQRIRQLLPMTFRDFLAATQPELARLSARHPAELQSEEVRRDLGTIAFRVDGYDLAWQNYLSCGGFPRSVAEFANLGGVSEPYARDLLAWLRADVDPDAPPDSVPRLLESVTERMTSPLNVANLSQALGYSSREVLDLRIIRLLNSHATLWCHKFDNHGRRIAGAQNKLYLTDPILAWLPRLTSPGLKEPDFTALSESTLGISLARRLDDLDEGRWVSGDTIGFVGSASGGEIDFSPVRVRGTAGYALTTPMESKWIDHAWRGAARSLDAKYGRGILATKSVLDVDGPVWAVPAPLLALLLQ